MVYHLTTHVRLWTNRSKWALLTYFLLYVDEDLIDITCLTSIKPVILYLQMERKIRDWNVKHHIVSNDLKLVAFIHEDSSERILTRKGAMYSNHQALSCTNITTIGYWPASKPFQGFMVWDNWCFVEINILKPHT